MTSKAGEISSIITEQIKQYESKIEMKENGTVITVGDGIATVYGLRSCMANELLRFEDGSFGVAQNLEEETVSVAILSDKDSIQEANLSLYEPLKLIPAGGVYVVGVTVLERTFLGICNIGTRPTLSDGRGQIVETHILDFDEEIYGLDLRIEFISRLRDERKFNSLDDLKKQLKKDLSAARKFEI